jgi:hypothetical protein
MLSPLVDYHSGFPQKIAIGRSSHRKLLPKRRTNRDQNTNTASSVPTSIASIGIHGRLWRASNLYHHGAGCSGLSADFDRRPAQDMLPAARRKGRMAAASSGFSALRTSAFNTWGWSIRHLEHSTPGAFNTWSTQHLEHSTPGAFDAWPLTHSVIIRFIVTAICNLRCALAHMNSHAYVEGREPSLYPYAGRTPETGTLKPEVVPAEVDDG